MARNFRKMHSRPRSIVVKYLRPMHDNIRSVRYQSITSLTVYKVRYNEYLVEISGSLACSQDYLYWFRLAVLGYI
jgi:hypothetical protein